METSSVTVCGLDLSLTSTGVVVLAPDGTIIKSENVRIKDKFPDNPRGETKRLRALADAISEAVPDYAGLVNIEALAFASNKSGHSANVGLHHMVRERLHERGVMFMTTAPTTLKKYVTGEGRCMKDMMMMSVLERWGIRMPNSDQADAYGLARLALMVIGLDSPADAYEKKTKQNLSVQLEGEA